MAKHMQPLCPIRSDAPCIGACCAWSRHTVEDNGMWLFTCAAVDNGIRGDGLAVIDRRSEDKPDPIDRT